MGMEKERKEKTSVLEGKIETRKLKKYHTQKDTHTQVTSGVD